MRIFGLEISVSPQGPQDYAVWHRPPALAKRIGGMTPTELRRELAALQEDMQNGLGYRMIEKDAHKRIISIKL